MKKIKIRYLSIFGGRAHPYEEFSHSGSDQVIDVSSKVEWDWYSSRGVSNHWKIVK